jgi:shikimate dehydrogenase
MPPRRSHLVGLIGAGIGPSLTPELHERAAERHGLRYVYRTIDIDALGRPASDVGALLAAAREFGFDALNITHPCKRAVLPFLDRLSPEASLLGAVNTVLFDGSAAVGHNTDGSGFARSFARGLPDADLDRVVLVGAGGAHLTVVDTDGARAGDLAADLRAHAGADRAGHAAPADLPALLAGASGLVNATPVGMAAHPGAPVPLEALRPRTWVADVVYRPADTPLLDHAAALGCRTLGGAGMAVFQAVEAFRLVTGIAPDPGPMLADMSALTAPPPTAPRLP